MFICFFFEKDLSPAPGNLPEYIFDILHDLAKFGVSLFFSKIPWRLFVMETSSLSDPDRVS